MELKVFAYRYKEPADNDRNIAHYELRLPELGPQKAQNDSVVDCGCLIERIASRIPDIVSRLPNIVSIKPLVSVTTVSARHQPEG